MATHRRNRSKEFVGDRKSRMGKGTGAPKKGGGGGKYTWGTILEGGEGSPAAIDKNDPNYNSEEEQKVVYKSSADIREEVQKYKMRVRRRGRVPAIP